jgi:hypothetical protein
MKKKFTLMMLLLLIFGSISFGQATASLATTTASPGEVVVVPLMVTNFTNVGAITFQIDFETSMLSFTNITPTVQPGNFIAHMNGSSLIITYTASPPNWLNVNGKLLDINFIYTGPGTTPLNFIPSGCEVVTGGMVPIPVTYTNGSVSQDLTITTKATLVGGTASTGGPVAVQLRFENFLVNAGAITQKVHYDVSKMDFVSAIGQGTLAGVIGSASGGVITLAWTNSAGADINWTSGSPANKILLNFVYTGSTTTDLEFYPGCIITTATPTNIKVSYYNGSVSPGPQVAHATLGSITGAQQGQDYEIPLTLSGFDALGANTAGAITLNISFNSPRLSFINASSNPHGATVNASGSVISIVWTNPGSPALIDGEFLRLKFKYNGIGVANLNFGAGCLFTTNTGSPIQVGYTNGTITPSANHDAYIGMPTGANGTDIAVPVYFNNMPSDVGAITLYIAFDDSRLTYHPVTDFPPVGSANFSVTGNVITIAWTSATPWSAINTNTFCNLNFHINGGGPAPITFEDGCEIANNAMPTPDIIPTNWHNGGVNMVNMAYMVSGFLTYNNVSNSPLVGFTVYLQDGPQPIPPAIVPIPANIASTTTDGNGYFVMSVPNGTYYLYASTTTPWNTTAVNSGDVIQLRLYIANQPNTILYPVTPPPPWLLRQLAANINWDGSINSGDVIALRLRIANQPSPNYLAPDWIFQNPVVIVNSANMINQNFMGILSGDVNGSYPNP